MEDMYSRTRLLLGDGTDDLKSSRVAVFGCGGVGSYIIEALARAGVGEIAVIDGDSVAESNINRQLVADRTTVGQRKAEVARERILRINPDCRTAAPPHFPRERISLCMKHSIGTAEREITVPRKGCGLSLPQ